MLTFAVGDIHGCYNKLLAILAKCEAYAGSARYRLIFLGDYIDRGPNSRSVVELLIQLQSTWADVVCLAGNHEQMLVRSIEDPVANAQWLNNGGDETLDSYSEVGGMLLLQNHASLTSRLPHKFDDGLRLFVHAGVDVSKSLDDQSTEDLLWMREPFLSYNGTLDRLIVHGHTPTRDGPEVLAHRINVDTGAVYGGALTAAIFNDIQALPLAFLSV